MIKSKLLKPLGILTIFFFIWFCFSANFTFAQSYEEDFLQKAKKLSQQGDYDGAIQILRDYIKKLKLIKEQKQKLAKAYHSLARTYYKVGEEESCDENLRMVFKTYPGFTTDETDFIFKDRVENIKRKEEEEEKVKAKVKIETKVKEKKKPVVRKEIPRKKVVKKIIPKPIKKKKKKKFPWILVIGGVVIVGIVLALLLSNKTDSESNGDNGDQVDPNYDTDVLGIEWIHIPAGEFKMGDNFNEGSSNERPVHAVYLDSYNISKYELIFEQYEKYCEAKNISIPDDKGWGRGKRPVINVSWNTANAFCNWLSQKTGKNIHLPTEAQWEKAARGTDQRRYPWGNSAPDCSKANYYQCIGKTKPVGSYPSGVSPYGVYDMAGNVWEWCSDYYSARYYSVYPYSNPTGPSYGSGHVFRGGGCYSDAYLIRSANRYNANPSYTYRSIGFRLCQD